MEVQEDAEDPLHTAPCLEVEAVPFLQDDEGPDQAPDLTKADIHCTLYAKSIFNLWVVRGVKKRTVLFSLKKVHFFVSCKLKKVSTNSENIKENIA